MFGTPQVHGVFSLRRVAADEALQFTLADPVALVRPPAAFRLYHQENRPKSSALDQATHRINAHAQPCTDFFSGQHFLTGIHSCLQV